MNRLLVKPGAYPYALALSRTGRLRRCRLRPLMDTDGITIGNPGRPEFQTYLLGTATC